MQLFIEHNSPYLHLTYGAHIKILNIVFKHGVTKLYA